MLFKALGSSAFIEILFQSILGPKGSSQAGKTFQARRVITKLIWTDVLVNISGLIFYLTENGFFLLQNILPFQLSILAK